MPRLIDANALIAFMKKGWRVFPSSELRHTCDITDIESAPTIDAVPVVRCKDCRFFHRYGFKLEYAECVNFDFYDTMEDGYCCWAERREDGKTD